MLVQKSGQTAHVLVVQALDLLELGQVVLEKSEVSERVPQLRPAVPGE